MLSMNVRQLYRDKAIAGVRIPVTLWFTTWGFWNIWYYDFVGSRLSHVAAMLAFAMNFTWAAMAIYYTRKNKKNGA